LSAWRPAYLKITATSTLRNHPGHPIIRRSGGQWRRWMPRRVSVNLDLGDPTSQDRRRGPRSACRIVKYAVEQAFLRAALRCGRRVCDLSVPRALYKGVAYRPIGQSPGLLSRVASSVPYL
jgi:hypothetical protein